MSSVFIKVSVKDRLPDKEENHLFWHLTDLGYAMFDFYEKKFFQYLHTHTVGVYPNFWLEKIPIPEDPRELVSTILVNSIVHLDKEQARGLVRELCERFELLPAKEDVVYESLLSEQGHHASFINGANYILNKLKGGNK